MRRDIHQQIAGLSEEKRALLARLLKQQGVDLGRSVIVPQRRDTGHFPLSFAQQRLWFLDQLDPHSAAYNLPAAVRLKGRLDSNALERSLQELVRRHESLRTSFAVRDREPVQVIAPELSFSLSLTDLQHLPEAEREAEALRLAGVAARTPFDLSQAPLLRASLVRLAADDHLLVLVMHHIISDGWSMGVFIREAVTLYHGLSRGLAPQLPSLPIQYADYACWQRDWLQGAELDKQLAYWTAKLRDCPAVLELPTDHPRTTAISNRGATFQFSLPPSLREQLTALSQAHGATLFMTLLAAFQALLARYTGQESISVGTPIASRTRPEVQNVIGFFVNTLVMNTDLSGNPDFTEILSRAKETALGAYAHQDLPFEHLVEALQPERDLSHSPLFQVMFDLVQEQPETARQTELSVTPVKTESGLAKFDLTLSMIDTATELIGVFEYNADLFEAATIARMCGHFRTLLEAIAQHPQQSLAQLPLLTTDEWQQLQRWNDTRADFPATSLPALIAAQAQAQPDAIAIQCGAHALTYRELNDRAAQLAAHLRRRGVARETIVGICLERSPELIIALLAVFKAGGAYLPLDPHYPADRLAFMLEDAQAQMVIIHSHLKSAISNLKSEIEMLCLDTDWPLMAQAGTDEVSAEVLPEQAAYVIYTSGSTGQPKGVLIEQRALANYVQAASAKFRLSAADRVLQFASISFDAAAEEIWPCLVQGATLVLRDDEMLASAAGFLARCAEWGITLLDLPTAYWHELVAEAARSELRLPESLRLVIIGGERAVPERLRQWQQLMQTQQREVRLLNTYGPTEATIVATWWEAGTEAELREVPIGEPVANATAWVLDREQAVVPVGVVGELCLGGAGLARGYLNRPELTAEKFIELQSADLRLQIAELQQSASVNLQSAISNPQSAIRLYRTGDLVRRRADGQLEYVGRVDEQVKLRGFRIELGEIEAALRTHREVKDAVVVVRADAAGHKRLVAYVVPGQANPAVNELRQHLQQTLPDYMVPAIYVFLAALPLNVSGKVDRRALPEPEEHSAPLSAEALPRTATEQKLAEIWQQVLGLRQVSVNDSFFALGGDSILSIQVIARARAAGLHLTPKQLFENPTISALAAVAGAAPGHEAEQGVVEGETPLVPIQRWFFAQHYPEPWHWNQAVLLALRSPLERALLERAIASLLHHHDALRMRYKHGPAGWRQINEGIGSEVPLQWFDLSDKTAAEQHTLIESAAQKIQASLNLNAGLLLRAAYFDCGAQPARLLLVIHHLVIDGVSWRVLLEDFQSAYAQLRQAQTPQLPAKTTSFRQWAQRLDEYAQSPEIHQQSDYWLSVTKGAAAHLPIDFNGANTEASGRSVQVELSEDETKSLLQDVPQAYGTEINDVLLTALGRALTQWTGERAVLVDLEGHGREDILAGVDVSRTVGWFTTVYPVRLETTAEWRAGDALKATKEQLRRIPQRGIGYGLLRYLSRNESVRLQLAAQPRAEVVFNYLGQFDRSAQNDGLLTAAAESSGAARSLRSQRGHVIDVTGVITGGRLQMDFGYSEQLHRRDTIERLAADFMAALRALIAHCLAPDAGGYTPSDFALARLDQKKLDKVLGKLDRAKNKRNRTSE